MQVFSTPSTTTNCPDDVCELYDHEDYDSSSSEQDYFPTDDDGLVWHTHESAENIEDFGMIVDFSEQGNVTCVHVPLTVPRSEQCRISQVSLIYIWFI